MPIETATFISQLAPANPLTGDQVSQGDDHLRLIKSVLQATFPNASKALYFPTTIAEQSADVTVVGTDNGKVIPVNASGAARTVNLPAAPDDGFEVTIQKTDSSANTVTIDPAGATLINGAASKALTRQFDVMRCIYLSTYAAWLAVRTTGALPFGSDDVIGLVNGGTGQTTAAAAFDALSTARADVASGATVDLDTNNSSYARITGTTTITAITLAAGRKRWVVFEGALTFTHGASLLLPGAASITTAAGDMALLIGEAAGVVRCQVYVKAAFPPWPGISALAALQADMETASSVVLFSSPGRQHYHPGHPKAWVTFKGSDGSIKQSYNVTSVTRGGAGNYTVNFTNAFSNADYCLTAWARDFTGGSGSTTVVSANTADTKTASACQIRCRRAVNDTAGDPEDVCVAFYGDL